MPNLDPAKQRAFAVEVVRELRAHSYEAYWAGGCVRDQIMGRAPKDYDVATTARPDEIRKVFSSRRTAPVGESFGVVCVVGPRKAGQIEVATFLQPPGYLDGRHPDAVTFSTPEMDAQRRDFTINGMFFDPMDQRVIDYVGGQQDLKQGVIRAIGDPIERFSEDKLRLLRAVRFTAGFGFELDPGTRAAVERIAAEVTAVSVERIAGELRLMLLHSSRVQAFALLRDVGLLAAVLPELCTNQSEAAQTAALPADEAWSTTLNTLAALDDPTFPLALAALLHAYVDAAGSAAICRRLKLSNRDTRRTRWLVEHHAALTAAEECAWPKLQRMLIAEGIDELLSLHAAIARASGRSTAHVEHCRNVLRRPPEELNPPPLVTGDDLVEHGVPRGKQYPRLLDAVRDAQLEQRIRTKDEGLALVDQLRAKSKN